MKLLASDYDGTIRIGKFISYRNIKAIKKWRKQGNVFGVVTGRTIGSIRKELQKYHIEVDFLIGNNGSIVLDKKGEIISHTYAPIQTCIDLIEDVGNKEVNGCIVSDGINIAPVFSKRGYALYLFGKKSTLLTYEDVKQNQNICQVVISAVGGEPENRAVAEYINATYGKDVCAYSNRSCVDIVEKSVNKATGVIGIQKHLKMDAKNVYTIGDSFNDVPMLETFQSATLFHANKEIQNAANEVVKDVASFIKKLESK